MRYTATYYDGVTARARPAAMVVTDAGILIFAAHGPMLAHWPSERVVLADLPRAGEPVRLGLDGTTERLIIDAPGVVEAVRPRSPKLYRRVRLSWADLARILCWAGAAAASLAVILVFVVPLLSQQLAAVTPDSLRQRIGFATLRQLTRLVVTNRSAGSLYCADGQGHEALRKMAVRLSAHMVDPPALRLVVVNTAMVNAFALPGNIVVLTNGLVENAVSPEEVAGVLAHELGHVVHDHGIQRMYSTAAVSVLMSVVIGDVAGGLLVGGLGRFVLNSGYSRAAEAEADRYALERLNAAGIDSRGLEAFFARVLKKRSTAEGSLDRLLSTHPPTRERLEALRGAARVAGKVFGNDRRQWPRLRGICQTTRSSPPRIITGESLTPSR